MPNQNINRWKSTKQQIVDIVVPSYTSLSKSCFFYIKQLEFPRQYITDMLRDFSDGIMTSYPLVKEKILLYSFL